MFVFLLTTFLPFLLCLHLIITIFVLFIHYAKLNSLVTISLIIVLNVATICLLMLYVVIMCSASSSNLIVSTKIDFYPVASYSKVCVDFIILLCLRCSFVFWQHISGTFWFPVLACNSAIPVFFAMSYVTCLNYQCVK